jgi:hypothetical protein
MFFYKVLIVIPKVVYGLYYNKKAHLQNFWFVVFLILVNLHHVLNIWHICKSKFVLFVLCFYFNVVLDYKRSLQSQKIGPFMLFEMLG